MAHCERIPVDAHLIRPAMPADAPAIAVIHVETWRAAYAGLIPASELAALSVERRALFWRKAIADHPGSVAVCTHEEQVTGFISFGASRDEDMLHGGEIYALYVQPAHWGQGCGHWLLKHALAALRKSGFGEAMLWVLEGNERAILFYASHGFVADGAIKEEVMMNATLREHRYRLAL